MRWVSSMASLPSASLRSPSSRPTRSRKRSARVYSRSSARRDVECAGSSSSTSWYERLALFGLPQHFVVDTRGALAELRDVVLVEIGRLDGGTERCREIDMGAGL